MLGGRKIVLFCDHLALVHALIACNSEADISDIVVRVQRALARLGCPTYFELVASCCDAADGPSRWGSDCA
eukprot:8294058-Karenia_brevis.AAC.1